MRPCTFAMYEYKTLKPCIDINRLECAGYLLK